ncbi:MAG TPA: N,N-dimethylformamidase beta subunit family domain-containing protein [Mycobacterium sp.]|nr:N,N-dimethylformamidase beta subunit family domain-containing protein [Mycobacterium sp.]
MKLDGGWRQSWDAILSGRFTNSACDGLLFYDAVGGTGEFFSVDGLGNMALLQSHFGWRTSWSEIVPGSYAASPFTGLLFYDRAAGHVELCSGDGLGNITLLQGHDGWRTSWDMIVPVDGQLGLTRLLFYDRDAGWGEIYATDGNGGLVLQQAYTGWRTTWSVIVSLQVGGNPLLLFYEAMSGHAELYAVDAAGDIQFIAPFSGWRSSWSIIRPVGLRASAYAGLVFYDRAAGVAELYTLNGAGNFSLVKTFAGWRNSWASITNGSFGGVFDDLLLYDRDAGEGELRALDTWPMGPLEGYVSSESVRPAEPITVHVRSTVGPFRAELLRRGLTDTLISTLGIFADQQADLPLDGPENGCTWPAAASVTVPVGSPSGLYIVRLSSLDGGVTGEVPFVVTAEAPGAGTGILFAISSSTYEAYCWWGGRSLYGHGGLDGLHWFENQAFCVSPHRPYLGPDDLVTPKFQYWEMPFIRWLGRNGIVVDYCTSNDLHANPGLLAQYRLIVTVGHDEYWSFEMRDHIEQFADNGGTVVALTGNTCWWQIRFDDPPAITCYKEGQLDPASNDPALRERVTVTWIEPALNRPETLMTGVSYQYGTLIVGDNDTEAPVYEVVAQHPVLQGTNLTIGDTFGTYTNNVGRRAPYKDGRLTVIGYECDARPTSPPGTGRTPSQAVNETPLDWRSNWESIIPADRSVGSSPDVLFYDRGLGEGELHRIDESGTLTLRRFHQGWRTTWNKIISGVFGTTGFAGLLFYDQSAGASEFYAVEANGDITLLRSHEGWRQSWDQIVPGNYSDGGFSGLLFYDRSAGVGEFYATDGSGNISLLTSNDGWRTSWDIIVPGNFGSNGHTDLLFYDRNVGEGEFYTVNQGIPGLLKTESGWRSSWDIILPLELGLGHTALLFYDRNAGTGEIYSTDGVGNISLLTSHTDWRTTWNAIIPLRLDTSNGTYLLFYEQDTGDTELYFIDVTGAIHFIHAYGDPAFMAIARSIFPVKDQNGNVVTGEYATMGVLRKGSGKVFSAGTTDWPFGLSQTEDNWTSIDQITANLLQLYGSAPQITRPIAEKAPATNPQPPSPHLRQQWDLLRARRETGSQTA